MQVGGREREGRWPIASLLRPSGSVWLLLGFQLGGRPGGPAQEENGQAPEPESPEPGGLRVWERRLWRGLHDQRLPVRAEEPRHRLRRRLPVRGRGEAAPRHTALRRLLPPQHDSLHWEHSRNLVFCHLILLSWWDNHPQKIPSLRGNLGNLAYHRLSAALHWRKNGAQVSP